MEVATGRWLVVVFLLFGRSGAQEKTACNQHNQLGYTSPEGDIVHDVGKDLIINCTLNKIFDLSHLYWDINGTHVIDRQFVTALDDRTAQLRWPNTIEADHQTYRCHLNKTATGPSENNQVCFNIVTVGHPPPSNVPISCISYGYKEIHCSWTLRPNPVKTKWTFKFRMNKKDYICGNLSGETANCTAHVGDFCANEVLTFTLTGTNDLKTAVVSTFNFSQDQNLWVNTGSLKPVKVGRTWAKISFDSCKSCRHHNGNHVFEYNLTIQRENGEKTTTEPLFNETTTESLLYKDLRNLIPFSNYTVELRCRLITHNATNPWGNATVLNLTTKAAVPGSAPEVMEGSYAEISSSFGYRNVTLFWKGVPKEKQFGLNFNYFVNGSECSLNTTETWLLCTNLSSDRSYNFTIRSQNEVGLSTESSHIFIDRQTDSRDDGEMQVHDVANHDGYKFTVSWQFPGSKDNVQFTVFWCYGFLDLVPRCNSSGISFRKPNTSASNLTLVLPKMNILTKNENYFFAVAAKVESEIKGMKWSTCTIPEDRDPEAPLTPLVHQGTTWLNVTWKPLACDTKPLYVAGYLIYFDFLNGSSRSYPVDGSETTSYNVTGLTPDTTYKFALATKTKTSESKEGAWITFNTLPTASAGDGSSTEWYFIAVPILCLVLLGLGTGIFFGVKRFREKLDEVNRIQLPWKLLEGMNTPDSYYKPSSFKSSEVVGNNNELPIISRKSTSVEEFPSTSPVGSHSSGFSSEGGESINLSPASLCSRTRSTDSGLAAETPSVEATDSVFDFPKVTASDCCVLSLQTGYCQVAPPVLVLDPARLLRGEIHPPVANDYSQLARYVDGPISVDNVSEGYAKLAVGSANGSYVRVPVTSAHVVLDSVNQSVDTDVDSLDFSSDIPSLVLPPGISPSNLHEESETKLTNVVETILPQISAVPDLLTRTNSARSGYKSMLAADLRSPSYVPVGTLVGGTPEDAAHSSGASGNVTHSEDNEIEFNVPNVATRIPAVRGYVSHSYLEQMPRASGVELGQSEPSTQHSYVKYYPPVSL